ARGDHLRRHAPRAGHGARGTGGHRAAQPHHRRAPGQPRRRRRLRQRPHRDPEGRRAGVTKAQDPFTLEIIQSSLQAISDEMFAAMRKTAMSAIIYEVLDMGTAITDGEGNLATSGAGIPAFVGVLDKAVKRILEMNPRDTIRP